MSKALPVTDVSAESLMGAIVDEFLERLGRGEPPDVESYARRYPQLATVLRQLLPTLRLMHPSAADHTRPGDDPATRTDPEGTLGDFRIVREIGRGGMGVVYEAVQISLGRRVALKVLLFAAALDVRQLRRFQNEAQAAAHLHHQHIVPVYAVGCERGVHYYAMQFIDGQTVAGLIQDLRGLAGLEAEGRGSPCESRLPGDTLRQSVAALPTERSTRTPNFFRRVALLGVQAALALEHAHCQGVVHRDVKPANLLIDGQGDLWVTDFGLAKVQTDTRLTMTGDLVGTLRYMSPEQALARGAGVDHRTDVYSLGATLYELLTLEPAFPGADRQELLRQIAWDEPKRPRRINPAVPAELETIVLKAMAKSPAECYATAQELADDLQRFVRDEPIRARRPTLVQRARKCARRHRAVVWAAAGGFFLSLIVLAGCIGATLSETVARQSRIAAEVPAALEEARRLQRAGKWSEGLAEAVRAEALLTEGGSEELRQSVRELRADFRMLARLEEVRLLLSEVKDGRFDSEAEDQGYAAAFRDYGVDVETLDPGEAAHRLGERAIRIELAAALDSWAWKRRHVPRQGGKSWRDLLAVARAIDPDPRRTALRDAVQRGDRQALVELAASADPRVLPPVTLVLLAQSLRGMGGIEEATALLRRTQEEYPGDFWIAHTLARYLLLRGPRHGDEAIRFYTAAVALRPESPGARLNFGVALTSRGRHTEALAVYSKAIELRPDYAEAHCNKGRTLWELGRHDEGFAALRKAIELKPGLAAAHANLGAAFADQGRLDEALAATRRGHELGSQRRDWLYPSAQWVGEYRRLVELDGRWDAIRRGEVKPASAAERNEFAQLCHYKRFYLASARLRAEAFATEPKLAIDLKAGHRYDAACAASLVGAGQGVDAGPLGDEERAHWRKRALEWLRADLAANDKLLASGGAEDRPLVRQRLWRWRWQQDPHLASLRDPAWVAELPADEREACQELWAEVQAVLRKADPAR